MNSYCPCCQGSPCGCTTPGCCSCNRSGTGGAVRSVSAEQPSDNTAAVGAQFAGGDA